MDERERIEVKSRVVASEIRHEVAGSFFALVSLSAVIAYVHSAFVPYAAPPVLGAWTAAAALVLSAWLVSLIVITARRPDDAELARVWARVGRAVMIACNAVIAASVWLLLPSAPNDLRLVMVVFCLGYVGLQLLMSTEGTQAAASAVIGVLGSVIVYVALWGGRFGVPIALFLTMVGGVFLAVRRQIRQNVVAATEARLLSERTAEELRQALEVVAAERDARTRFIRAASHDLSQPLQAGRLFFEEMERTPEPARRARAAAGVRRAFASTAALLDGMLMHLRLEAGVVRSVPELIDLDDFAAEVAFDYQLVAAEAGVTVRLPRSRLQAHTDPQLLKRVIGNFVANGVRHSRGEHVMIAARRRGSRIRLWVLDDGDGIEPGVATHLFEEFAQGARSERAGGFGLGLASARKLAEAMGGQVGHDPRWRSGSAFFIDIPSAEAAPPSPDTAR